MTTEDDVGAKAFTIKHPGCILLPPLPARNCRTRRLYGTNLSKSPPKLSALLKPHVPPLFCAFVGLRFRNFFFRQSQLPGDDLVCENEVSAFH